MKDSQLEEEEQRRRRSRLIYGVDNYMAVKMYINPFKMF